jgi:comEA protein
MKTIILSWLKQHRMRIIGGTLCLLLAAGIAWVPALHAQAGAAKRLVLGDDSPPVTIITNDEKSAEFAEKVALLEKQMGDLQAARKEDAILITQLRDDYQKAVAEVGAAHDTFAKEADQVQTLLKASKSKSSTSESESANTTTSSDTKKDDTTTTKSKKISINKASASELDSLPGIGPAYAQRIVDYRNEHGPFKSIDELDNVSGIGSATIEKLRDLVEL